ncbi:MAG: hypothetical protein K9N51_06910 [Candidatus Pacebacteria bacterium]|nr:hypothetical protein [Candidatus Paceibacterota bacterium]
MADKTHRIVVFGKPGCPKCKLLNQRIDKLLRDTEWTSMEKTYYNVETEDGLVAFCKAECLNPQRIPAFLVTRKNEESGRFEPIENPTPGAVDNVCKDAKLYTYLGLQTDYTEQGRGLVSPKMIKAVFSEALAQP